MVLKLGETCSALFKIIKTKTKLKKFDVVRV